MIDAAERARDMNLELLASIEMLNGGMAGETAAAAENASANDAAANAALFLGTVNVEASENVERLATRLNDQMDAADKTAAADEVLSSRLNDMRDSAAEAAAAMSTLEYSIAAAGLAADTAAVMARPAMDEWRESIASAAKTAAEAEVLIDNLAGAFDASGADAVLASVGIRDYRDAIAEAAAATAVADKTTEASGKSASVAAGFWARWGNVIHWVVAGSAELLAVVLPAAVAAGAAAFVLYQGAIEQVGFRLTALYGTTEATAAMIGKTTGDVLGLGHAFQTAQNAANPIAYELLGEYVDAAKGHMVDLAQAGLTVDKALAGLGARIDVDLLTQGASLNSLLANMVSDLIEIGQVFGNFGHAILNVAADMPGLAEALLGLLDGLSHVVLFLTNPAWYNFGGHLITIVMGMEEFSRWGGLAVTILGKMGLASAELGGGLFSVERFTGIMQNLIGILPMAALGVANLASRIPILGAALIGETEDVEAAQVATKEWIEGLSTLQTFGIAGTVAGLAIMWIALSSAKTGAEEFADSLQEAADKASNLQVTGVLLNNLAQLAPRLTQATAANDQFSTSLGHTQMAGKAAVGVLTDLRGNQDTYSSALKSTMTQMANVNQGAALPGEDVRDEPGRGRGPRRRRRGEAEQGHHRHGRGGAASAGGDRRADPGVQGDGPGRRHPQQRHERPGRPDRPRGHEGVVAEPGLGSVPLQCDRADLQFRRAEDRHRRDRQRHHDQRQEVRRVRRQGGVLHPGGRLFDDLVQRCRRAGVAEL